MTIIKDLRLLSKGLSYVPNALRQQALEYCRPLIPTDVWNLTRCSLDLTFDCSLGEDIMSESEAIAGLIGLMSSGRRLKLFMTLAPLLHHRAYWLGLGMSYINSDWLDTVSIQKKRALFTSPRPYSKCLMTNDELKVFTAISHGTTIYRGMTVKERESGKFGISWTLDQDTAKFFAEKYHRHGRYLTYDKVVHALKFNRRRGIAYFNRGVNMKSSI